jgi:hypothetical protein
MEWEPARRRLTVAVSHVEHEPALDAIAFAFAFAFALGLDAAAPRAQTKA